MFGRPVFWRVAHKFCIFAPPALGTGYLGILGLAAQAKSGTDARAIFDGHIVMWRAIMLAPYGAYWFFVLLLTWLVVVLWSGAKMEEAGRQRVAAPVERQPRVQAVSPRSIDVQNRKAADFWLNQGHPKGGPLSALVQGLRDGLSGGLVEPRPKARVDIPKRDKSLAEGLVYALTGSWDTSVLDTLLAEENVDGFNYRKREFERDARGGKLTVWGRERMMDIFADEGWDLIEPEFWEANRVSWSNMILGDTAKTESKSGYGNGDQYEDLMVSRAEFEERWPHE